MRSTFIEIVSLLLIILFTYAATNKLMDIDTFRIQLSQSPLLTPLASFISWFIPSLELAIAALLLTQRFRLVGLYAGYGLMVAFTAYIVAILGFSDFVPCSCGGILEKLGWTEHLVFNLVFVALPVSAIVLADRVAVVTQNRSI
jgi:hypothetical protein